MSKVALVSTLFGLAVLALLVFLTLDLKRYSCEACMTFQGQTNCARASGKTEAEALRTAKDTACATISAGMTESIQCSNKEPDSVKWF